MRTLEEATVPLQEYLDVSLTRDAKDAQVANRLPKPLATLFEKFKDFSRFYPQFRLKVSVKGDPNLTNDFFLKYETQLMSNPVRHIRAHRSKLLKHGEPSKAEIRHGKKNETKEVKTK